MFASGNNCLQVCLAMFELRFLLIPAFAAIIFRALLYLSSVLYGNIKLSGATSFSASAVNTLTLISNGTYWVETSRALTQ